MNKKKNNRKENPPPETTNYIISPLVVSANVIKHFICAFRNCLFYEWGLPFHSAKYRFPITYAMWWNYFQYWMHPFMWKGFQIFILGVFVAGIFGMRLWKQFTLLFCRVLLYLGVAGGRGNICGKPEMECREWVVGWESNLTRARARTPHKIRI